MNFHRINKHLILTPKLLYFFINAQYYTFYNFRSIFLQQGLNIRKGTYGLIVGGAQLITFFTNMLIAFATDKTQKPKLAITLCLIGSAVVFQLFYFNYAIFGSPIVMYSLLFLLFTTLMSSVQPILDKLMLDYLKNYLEVPQTLYGKQRLWGTLSYAITNFIIEAVLYRTGEKNPDFKSLGFFEILFASIAIPLVFFLAPADRPGPAATREPPRISKLIRQKEYMFFMAVILLNGITRGTMTNYLTLYYKHGLKLESAAPPSYIPGFLKWAFYPFYKSPVATCSSFGIVLEIVVLFASKSILRKGGLHWPLLLSQILQAFRFIGYLSINEKTAFKLELACCIELLKGMNFGLTHISGVQLATRLVPPELKATSQTFYAGTFIGLGAFIGSLTGVTLDTKESSHFTALFVINLVICLASILMIFVKYGLIDGKLGSNREVIAEERERPPLPPKAAPPPKDVPLPKGRDIPGDREFSQEASQEA